MTRKTFWDPTVLRWSPTMALPNFELSPEDLVVDYWISPAETKHRAFAAGFFAFHYIRATLEKEPSLRKDSLHFLQRLLESLGVKKNRVEDLNLYDQQSYTDFEGKIIKPISLELGDSICPAVQWMMVFGFYFAIILSSLVTATDQLCKERTDSLEIIKMWIKKALFLAEKAEVSETTRFSLTQCEQLFKQSKTKITTCKCRDIIMLATSQLLVTGVASELMN